RNVTMNTDHLSTQSVRLNPTQELKLAKPAIDLYVGQVLKAVVINSLSENQVTISINGQNINANTAHHFVPGELMQVKVVQIGEETILQIIPEKTSPSILQSAIAQNLPRQASATQLFALLSVLQNHQQLPQSLNQSIQQLMTSL